MISPIPIHGILADSAPEFSFSGFQKTFQEAWDFLFPNILLLALCFAVAWFVGRVELPWLRLPWNKVQDGIRVMTKFLEDSNLFGSKLLPALVLIISALVFLNVFGLIRTASHNLLPPHLTYTPSRLYQRLASPELLVRLLALDSSISEPYMLYDKIGQWEERVVNDRGMPGGDNVAYWNNESGDWARYGGDIKLLAAVAIFSLLVGVWNKHWMSMLRFLSVGLILTAAYVYCLAKELYAKEQLGHATLTSLAKSLHEEEKEEWSKVMEIGLKKLTAHEDWFSTTVRGSSPWWELRWLDLYFYHRTAELLRGGINDPTQQSPVLSKDQFEDLRTRFEPGSAKDDSKIQESKTQSGSQKP